jgi:uncharacterized protein
MLGKIARKLRILGFDTMYILDIEDREILDLLIQTKRILLTSDKGLYQRAKKYNCQSIFINKNTEIENLISIFNSLAIKFTDIKLNCFRCSICNTKLNIIEDPNTIKNEVHRKVFESNTIFYRCYRCNKLYWWGSHINSISLLIEKINKVL